MSEGIEVHSIVEGTVVRIKPFGAIVRIGESAQGLVHISHVSSQYVQDINDFLAVGDTVQVKVLSIDPESGRIALSIKDTEPPAPRQAKPRSQGFGGSSGEAGQAGGRAESFEDKLKEWVKVSNDRHAGLNKRNKRR